MGSGLLVIGIVFFIGITHYRLRKNKYLLIFYFLAILSTIFLSPHIRLSSINFLNTASNRDLNLPFISNQWKDQSLVRSSHPVRQQMIDNLLSKHKFIGYKKEYLISLLGEPEVSENLNQWDLVYRLGPEQKVISFNDEWLVFKFNKENEVIDYRVITD